jgi:hypothetical protein
MANINQNKMKKKIINGDVFDIGQTVNGVSKFLWFNDKWYYFEERMTREYEYDQEDLTKTILDSGYFSLVSYLGNILELNLSK